MYIFLPIKIICRLQSILTPFCWRDLWSQASRKWLGGNAVYQKMKRDWGLRTCLVGIQRQFYIICCVSFRPGHHPLGFSGFRSSFWKESPFGLYIFLGIVPGVSKKFFMLAVSHCSLVSYNPRRYSNFLLWHDPRINRSPVHSLGYNRIRLA